MPSRETYLSGWEYNRILQRSPTIPRNSALPTELLWNGAAHLWMYETVYCTSQSLDNEYAASELLGWPTGKMFAELENLGIIARVDWESLPTATQLLLSDAHRELRVQYGPASIRSLIASGDTQTLESIKLQLIKPIAEYHHALSSVSPNCLNLKEWQYKRRSAGSSSSRDHARVETFLRKLAEPVHGTRPTRARGLRVCRRPGLGVSRDLVVRQRQVQREIEAPMVADLIAGEGEFAGSKGYVPYFEYLLPHRDAYRAINDQLAADWSANKTTLLAVREEARKHLWPQLHNEWLSQLLDDPIAFGNEFSELIDMALRHPRLAGMLDIAAP